MHASLLHNSLGNLVSHGVRRAAVYLCMYQRFTREAMVKGPVYTSKIMPTPLLR